MKRCEKCKKTFADPSQFCVYCGTALTEIVENEKPKYEDDC